MNAIVPDWEKPVHRFLRGEGRLKMADGTGEVFNLWEALLYFPDYRYPIRLGDRSLTKADLQLAATLQLSSGAESRLQSAFTPVELWRLKCIAWNSPYAGVVVPSWMLRCLSVPSALANSSTLNSALSNFRRTPAVKTSQPPMDLKTSQRHIEDAISAPNVRCEPSSERHFARLPRQIQTDNGESFAKARKSKIAGTTDSKTKMIKNHRTARPKPGVYMRFEADGHTHLQAYGAPEKLRRYLEVASLWFDPISEKRSRPVDQEAFAKILTSRVDPKTGVLRLSREEVDAALRRRAAELASPIHPETPRPPR